jgi:hypothetical protein
MLNVLLIEWHCIWLREKLSDLYSDIRKKFLVYFIYKDIG